MKGTSLSFDQAMEQGQDPSLLLFFANGYGARIYSDRYPPKLADAEGDEHLADGTFRADGSIKAGGGLGSIFERGARVLDWGSLAEADETLLFSESFDEGRPPELSVLLDNSDLALSEAEGGENILSALVRIVAIQAGTTEWADHLVLGDFIVRDYTLTREGLSLRLAGV